jgi:hypothetical protein
LTTTLSETLLAGVEQLGGQLAKTGMYAPALPVTATAELPLNAFWPRLANPGHRAWELR